MIGEVLTAFVIAAGSALTAVIATAGISALNKGSYIVAAIFGAMSAAKDYRSLNKMPPIDSAAPPIPVSKVPMIILIAGLSISGLVGCATLSPGADPLVVRAEQAEQSGKATFDLVLGVDSSARVYWMSNAPAFHSFCEKLRKPIMFGTNEVPTCIAMIMSLDQTKQDYKNAKLISAVTSNNFYTVLITTESAINQAAAWYTVATNTIH